MPCDGEPPDDRIPLASLATLCAVAAGTFVPSAALAGDVAAGKEKYAIFCATCHGEAGKGDGPGGVGLQPPPRDFSAGNFKFDADGNGTPGEDADLKLVIEKGAEEFGGSQLMTPWGGALTDEDLDNLVAVIRSLEE